MSMKRKDKNNLNFTGTWYIEEMETWSEDYFNMEVQAFIRINSNNMGDFQFGLVQGNLDGKVEECPGGPRFEFTWEGVDEMDPVHGSGWLKVRRKVILEGEFRIHLGDRSTFLARRAW